MKNTNRLEIWTIIVIILFSAFLISSCTDNHRERDERKVQATTQHQQFTTISVGDTFHLTDYNVIEPEISYMNEYTTTYRVWYDWYQWHVTIDNKTKIVKMLRSYK